MGAQERFSINFFRRPGRPMDARARQVRFMSTQKRVNRSQPIRCTDRAAVSRLPADFARHVCAAVIGRTAPVLSILWSALAWVATEFLHPDYQYRQLVRPVLKADRRGSPPPRVRCRAALGKLASPRSSLPHIAYPSGPVYLHRPLPNAPAASCRRAERYDGQRDLYFQHAA